MLKLMRGSRKLLWYLKMAFEDDAENNAMSQKMKSEDKRLPIWMKKDLVMPSAKLIPSLKSYQTP